MTTFCPHGVSHQPGEPVQPGNLSVWCGECFPADDEAIEATHNERYRAWQVRQSCERPTMWGQS
jgi:hypothetical protein